jgi:hypothetical protein
MGHLEVPRVVVMVLAFVCGVVGVGGSVLLVWESRLTFAILREETGLVVEGLHVAPQEPTDKSADA